jgi:hypothetical protein
MVVIIDVDFHIFVVHQFRQFSDATPLPGVYEDEALGAIQVNVSQLGEIEEIRSGVEKKVSEVFFLGSCKYEGRFRIELFRGNHGRQSIEVSVHVGRDDFLMGFCRWGKVPRSLFLRSFHGGIIAYSGRGSKEKREYLSVR